MLGRFWVRLVWIYVLFFNFVYDPCITCVRVCFKVTKRKHTFQGLRFKLVNTNRH